MTFSSLYFCIYKVMSGETLPRIALTVSKVVIIFNLKGVNACTGLQGRFFFYYLLLFAEV